MLDPFGREHALTSIETYKAMGADPVETAFSNAQVPVYGGVQRGSTRRSPVTRLENRRDPGRPLCCSALRLPAEFPHSAAPESVKPPRSATERLKTPVECLWVPLLKCGRYGTIYASDGYLIVGATVTSFYL